MKASLLRSLLVMFLMCPAAHAVCTLFNSPMRFVGDSGADSRCTDDTIQSAIDAIANDNSACPAKIFITSERTYSSQSLVISNTGKNITFIGQGTGVVCGTTDIMVCPPEGCPPPPTAPFVTVSGTSGNSVFHIDGNNDITLRYLTVSLANLDSNQGGGGIYFNGSGSLTLDTSVVSFNTAGYGGGIDFIGSGGAATLNLLSNTLILSNTASVDGGGVRTEGSARLFALKDQTLIAFNHALNGHGGGLDVIAPSRADVGSSGYGSLGVIYDNEANYGGGVSVNDGGNNSESGTVRFFTTNAAKPVRISGNFATSAGGALYLKPYTDFNPSRTGANACLFDFVVDDNRAPDGGAIYADYDSAFGGDVYGSNVQINGADMCGPESPPTLGAVACAAGIDCNDITGNTAEDSGNALSGTLVEINNSTLTADRFKLTGNTGITAIRSDAGRLALSTCLMAGNHTQSEVVSNHGSYSFSIDGCTIAGNTIDNGYVIYSDTDTSLLRSIIDQPNRAPYDRPSGGGSLTSQYILSNDISGLAPGTIMQGEPVFVNAAAGDYHLADGSLGIDFAPAMGGSDLDRKPRDVDLIQMDNDYGPRDIGAYERQSVFACGAGDSIFCNGFEP